MPESDVMQMSSGGVGFRMHRNTIDTESSLKRSA